ncbi:flagellin [Fibrobacterota bacterium]
MRINHNIAAMASQTSLMRAQKDLYSSLEKLSTGLRINRASDDVAGLAVSEQLRTQVRGLAQAKRNADDGIALLQIAEGAAKEIADTLQRMRELAIQSANGTLTSVERGYTDSEFQALMQEVQRIAQGTQYNGMTLLDGQSGSFGVSGGANSVIHIGANNNNGSATGTIDSVRVSIDAITLGSVGLTLTTASDNGTNITSAPNSSAAITQIDVAIKSVNNMRSGLGSMVNRLEHAVNNLSDQQFNMESAESLIRDVDFAVETTKFTRAQILSQSSLAMLAQANAIPGSILSLYGG